MRQVRLLQIGKSDIQLGQQVRRILCPVSSETARFPSSARRVLTSASPNPMRASGSSGFSSTALAEGLLRLQQLARLLQRQPELIPGPEMIGPQPGGRFADGARPPQTAFALFSAAPAGIDTRASSGASAAAVCNCGTPCP